MGGRIVGVALIAAVLSLGCGSGETVSGPGSIPAVPEAFPGAGLGKTDVFGRALAGVAAPYEADATMESVKDLLAADMELRREVAWSVVARVLDPVPLLGLAEVAANNEDIELPEGEVPQVARWQTWYGVDDFKRMFRYLFEGLGPAGRGARAPFTAEAIEEAFAVNAAAIERSERWPLERFLRYVQQLGVCKAGTPEEECAQSLQSQFSGAAAGNTRITYSPGTIRHLLENYSASIDCLETLKETAIDTAPTDEESNFTACFDSEFPVDAVLIKAHWVRADFGRPLPAFDTDAAGLQATIGEGKLAEWGDGQRQAQPTPDEVVTIKMGNGDTYRLAGLHIMTKELRHWLWITLWWSDTPDSDFGADRPEAIAALDPVWSHYKMGVVVDYVEGDADPGASFPEHPTLAEALTVAAAASELGSTWLSNPYIEHGGGNARTNCIGCHQHGGSIVGQDLDGDETLDPFSLDLVIDSPLLFPDHGRTQLRSLFPADYLWSTSRVDSLGQVVKSQVDNFDYSDTGDAPERAAAILALEADPAQGEMSFAQRCTPCHGLDGQGTPSGPNLYERVPSLDDQTLAETILLGKSPMPSWNHLEDTELANIAAWVREEFGL